ncbi:MAG: hexameric tyrosine-coordinated heme protein [Parvularculaceae bacterium]
MSHHGESGFPATLATQTVEEGFDLAIKLSRLGVRKTQPDMSVLKKLRPKYANNADSLTAASQVVAINFQTIAAANNYWRS